MISAKEVLNKNIKKGYSAIKKFRDALVDKLYETSVVVNKVTIEVDDKTGKVTENSILGVIGHGPVAEAFGLDRDYRAKNVTVEEEVNNNKITRKVDIDGFKYIYCDSLITIECSDEEKIKDLARNGYILNTVNGVAEYRVLGSSPSNEKNAVKYYYKVTDEIPTEEDAYKLMDSVTGYAFSKGLFHKPLLGKKITKGNTRWGNYLSNMKALGKIDLSKDYIAVVDGSIAGACDFDDKTKEEMKVAGIEIDNNINDGADYFAVDLVQEIAENVGIELTEDEAVKVALQNRPTVVTGKSMNRTLRQKDMLILAKNSNAKFYGNTDTGRLMMLIDEDGAKLINKQDLVNGTAVIDVYIMAMAKASKVKSSSQHLIKYMAVNAEATIKFVKEQIEVVLDKFVEGMVEDETTGSMTVNSKIVKALGEDSFDDKLCVETMMKDSFTFIKSAITKNKFSIDGIYSHMMFDLSYALTNKVVSNILGLTKDGFVEAYSEDVLRMYHKEISAIENNINITEEDKESALFDLLSGIVVKYPSAMPKEYEIVVYKTKRQMLKRISNLKASNSIKATLKRYIEDTPYGCTVYAPINALKNKLAGADVDFDATMTDMSELKWILIDERRKEQKTNPGFMGECTFISYKDIDRSDLLAPKEVDSLDGADNIEL